MKWEKNTSRQRNSNQRCPWLVLNSELFKHFLSSFIITTKSEHKERREKRCQVATASVIANVERNANVRSVPVRKDSASVEKTANAIHANVSVNQVNNVVPSRMESHVIVRIQVHNLLLDKHVVHNVVVERNDFL